jgi:membrane associated rhomboid family serine protease
MGFETAGVASIVVIAMDSAVGGAAGAIAGLVIGLVCAVFIRRKRNNTP